MTIYLLYENRNTALTPPRGEGQIVLLHTACYNASYRFYEFFIDSTDADRGKDDR